MNMWYNSINELRERGVTIAPDFSQIELRILSQINLEKGIDNTN